MVNNSGIVSYSIIEPAAYLKTLMIRQTGILSSWDELKIFTEASLKLCRTYDIEASIQLILSAFSVKDWFRFHLSNKGMLNISSDLYGKTWWSFIINKAASGG